MSEPTTTWGDGPSLADDVRKLVDTVAFAMHLSDYLAGKRVDTEHYLTDLLTAGKIYIVDHNDFPSLVKPDKRYTIFANPEDWDRLKKGRGEQA